MMTAPDSNGWVVSPVAAAVNPASSLPGERLGMRLSEREMAALAAYARTGAVCEAAHTLGANLSTVRNWLGHAYEKLGVYGAINAFRELGWLHVPEEVA